MTKLQQVGPYWTEMKSTPKARRKYCSDVCGMVDSISNKSVKTIDPRLEVKSKHRTVGKNK